jgi:hypothetical protein
LTSNTFFQGFQEALLLEGLKIVFKGFQEALLLRGLKNCIFSGFSRSFIA